MRKYWTFFIVEWQQALNYRGESLVWFILELIPLVVMVNLSGYLQTSGRINHFQHSQLVLYYIIILFVSRLSSVHFEDSLIDDIKDGKISPSLMKPFSFYWHLFPRELAWRLAGLIYLLPSLLIILPLLSSLEIPAISLSTIIIFTFSIIMAYLQRFFFGWIVSIPAFWFDQSKALVHFKWMLEGLFGGAWLPLYLFPSLWQNISRLTPFYYWYYFPIQLLLGNTPDLYISLLISLAWMFLLYWISYRFWKYAVRFYSSVGG